MTQPACLLARITQNLENIGESTPIDEDEPFLERVFRLNHVIRIDDPGFNPLDDLFESRRIFHKTAMGSYLKSRQKRVAQNGNGVVSKESTEACGA